MSSHKHLKIRVDDAARYFGSKAELARTLGINPQALTGWGEYLPELRAYKLRDMYPNEVAFMLAQSAGSVKAA